MRLTVLGKSPSWEDSGGACSSYLIEESSTVVLLDCGSGALGKLRARADYRDLDAIVLSHFHADHLLDLVPLACAFTYGPASTDGTVAPRLIAPAGAEAFFRRLGVAIDDESLIVDAFAIEEYEPSSETSVGEIAVRTHPVPHIGPTHAVDLAGPSGARIVFGADGPYSDELIAAAHGAEVLIAEATLPDPDASQHVHMSAAEAGKLAREAAVGRLVLTHISDELDLERARDVAAEAFGGPVEVAAEGATYDVL
jgi:ribonuclease BN (tRNA processing enzyme)